MKFNILSYCFSIFANYAFFYNFILLVLDIVLANCIIFVSSGFLVTAVLFTYLLGYVLSFFFLKKTIFKKTLKLENA